MKCFNFKLFVLAAFAVTSLVQGKVNENFKNVYDNRVFFTYDQVVANMKRLQNAFPLYTERVAFGNKTADGNQMYYQKLQNSRGLYLAPNPWIVVVAGLNGNDWTSTGAVMAFMEKFLGRRLAHDKEAKNMLDNFDWIIIPVANPDGYKYTRSTKRNWVMNTRRVPGMNCHGVNLNKNFMFLYQATDNQCSKSYSGPSHFSEVESQAIRDLVASLGKYFVGFMSVFDRGQAVVVPPVDGDAYYLRMQAPFGKIFHLLSESERVGPFMAKAMSKAAGTKHKYGTIDDVFRPGTADIQGTAVDYIQYKYPGIYTYQIHLRPTARTPPHIHPRGPSILTAGKELYAGLSAFIEHADGDYMDELALLPRGQARRRAP